MSKVIFLHEPEGFSFYICDENAVRNFSLDSRKVFDRDRFYTQNDKVEVGVIREFSPIQIAVELDENDADEVRLIDWDRVIETSIDVTGRTIHFESCIGDKFGHMDVEPGRYRIRIYYGGQNTRELDGSSKDYYLIQIWPSNDQSEKIIKS